MIKTELFEDVVVAAKPKQKRSCTKRKISETTLLSKLAKAIDKNSDPTAAIDAIVTTVVDDRELPLAELDMSGCVVHDFLAAKNPHILDTTIKFVESTHTYYVKWYHHLMKSEFDCTDTISVSGLVHNYFEDFDADKIIGKMKNGKKFATSVYAGMSADEIKDLWEKNRVKASTEGTTMHMLLELFFTASLDISKYQHFKCVKQFVSWKDDVFVGFVPFRTEMRLRTWNDMRVTGTADLIAVKENHPEPTKCGHVLSLYIFDWKTSKKITKYNPWQSGKGCCESLPDTNFSHYSLQQNCYTYMLEYFYTNFRYNGHIYKTVKVVAMELAIFHDTRQGYERVVIPRLDHIVCDMFKERKEMLTSRVAPQQQKV